ncbi:MAG: ABC transporter permease, partial [Clostridia bacterium]
SLYMVINALIFTFVCLSIGFIIGTFIKSRNAQSAIANVLTLGLCFIGGVFVPQEFLGGTVQSIARFTPTYWYVKVINDLDKLPGFTFSNLKPVFLEMLMQLLFAVGLLAIGLLISRRRRFDI